MSKIYVGTAVGLAAVGLGFAAVGAAELNDFAQPSAAACLRSRGVDFGPPAGCDDGSQPHNRTVQVTALSTGNGSLTVSNGVTLTYDAEYFQLDDLQTTKISRSNSA